MSGGAGFERRNTDDMRQRLLMMVLALLPVTHAAGQWDTAGLRLTHLQAVPVVTATVLAGAGSVATFVPAAKDVAVGLRDAVVAAELPRLHVDDYVQYVPLAVPLALDICGVKGRHSLGRMAMIEGGSYLLGAGWLHALKMGIGVLRPDGSTYNSFPSGHTFTAFTGAEILRREYGEEYPWVAVAGYAVAAAVGMMRIYNNRHWVGDVLGGAGLALLSVTIVYWALD